MSPPLATRKKMADLRPDATFNVGADPDWMAVASDAVWVTAESANSLTQLLATSNKIGLKIEVGKPCSGLVAGFGSLWIPSCGKHVLMRVDLKTGKISSDHRSRASSNPRVESR
jgi:virginiamycin B lyase